MTKIKDYIRGDTRFIGIPCLNADGSVMNLTGAKLYFTLNSSDNPADDTSMALQKTDSAHVAPITATLDNGVTYTSGQNTAALGIGWITILPTDTTALTPGIYNYDIQVKDASSNVYSIKKDTFTINADITRSTT